MPKAAVIQLVSSDNVADNCRRIAPLIQQAAEQGASMVFLPEDCCCMCRQPQDKLIVAETLGEGEIQDFMRQQAITHRIWLSVGSIYIKSPETNKVYSTTLVFDPQGNQVVDYQKRHLYDVQVADQESYLESQWLLPGQQIQVFDCPLGKLGLSICYDVRFPELYRTMMHQGAQLFAVPSAFTATTGHYHWALLLRARAVENLCYVIAPNQGGVHANGRSTYGHSMIISPWGEVLAQSTTGVDIIIADIDLVSQAEQRQRFPVLQHWRADDDGK